MIEKMVCAFLAGESYAHNRRTKEGVYVDEVFSCFNEHDGIENAIHVWLYKGSPILLLERGTGLVYYSSDAALEVMHRQLIILDGETRAKAYLNRAVYSEYKDNPLLEKYGNATFYFERRETSVESMLSCFPNEHESEGHPFALFVTKEVKETAKESRKEVEEFRNLCRDNGILTLIKQERLPWFDTWYTRVTVFASFTGYVKFHEAISDVDGTLRKLFNTKA